MACPLCDDTGWKTVETATAAAASSAATAGAQAASQQARRRRAHPAALPAAATSTTSLLYRTRGSSARSTQARRFADGVPGRRQGPVPRTGRPASARRTSRSPCCKQRHRDHAARAGSSTTRAICCASSAAPTTRSIRTDGDGHPAAGDGRRPARARRSRRGEDLRVGRGDDEPHRQHALQRAAPDDLHVELRGHARRGTAIRTRCKARIGFRMHSRLHEMCEFLEFDGADYRQLPPNGGADDLRRAVEAAPEAHAGAPAMRRARRPRRAPRPRRRHRRAQVAGREGGSSWDARTSNSGRSQRGRSDQLTAWQQSASTIVSSVRHAVVRCPRPLPPHPVLLVDLQLLQLQSRAVRRRA